jgi:hypothetical protein
MEQLSCFAHFFWSRSRARKSNLQTNTSRRFRNANNRQPTMSNQTEAPLPRPAQMHLQTSAQTSAHMPSDVAARASERAEYAVQAESHGLRVHEWQLNVTSARVSPPTVRETSELPHHRSALDVSAPALDKPTKAFFHAANAFETRVATLLMYNAARVKRM